MAGDEGVDVEVTKIDPKKVWVPLGVAVVLFGAGWWLRDLTLKVDSIALKVEGIQTQMQTVTKITGQVGENAGRIDVIQEQMTGQDRSVDMMTAWILTTRISLAEQGFKTPPFSPQKGE